jgi:hypothetical protein
MNNVEQQINKLIDSRAKELCRTEFTALKENLDRNNFNYYFTKCVEVFSNLDVSKFEQDYLKTEESIMFRINELNNFNSILESLICEKDSFPSKDQEEQLKQSQSVTENCASSLNKIQEMIEKLETDSIDSIKKMKFKFENSNDISYHLKSFHKSRRDSLREAAVLLETKMQKEKIKEEKEEIYQSNRTKVNKCEIELESTKKDYNQACTEQQALLEEIQLVNGNILNSENEIKALESSVIPGGKKFKYRAGDKESKQLVLTIDSYRREVENSRMQFEETKVFQKNNIRKIEADRKKNFQGFNFVGALGLFMYYKLMINKV